MGEDPYEEYDEDVRQRAAVQREVEQRSEETTADAIFLALKERFAKAWDSGYAQGVADAEAGGLDGGPTNPWRAL